MDEPLTEEQQAELETKAAKVDEMTKSQGELEEKHKEELKKYEDGKVETDAKIKELEESSNPNWKKTRERIAGLESALKEKGVELNDDGSVKSNPQNVDVDDLLAKATKAGEQAATKTMLGGNLDKLLSVYEPKSKEVIKVFYDKLTVGEDVNLDNMQDFITQAENAASVNPENKINKVSSYTGGQGPRTADTNKLDDSRLQDIGKDLGLGFAKSVKK